MSKESMWLTEHEALRKERDELRDIIREALPYLQIDLNEHRDCEDELCGTKSFVAGIITRMHEAIGDSIENKD